MRTLVSFRLTNDSGGTAADVSKRLELIPTWSREAGAVISARNPEQTAQHSVWSLSSAPDSQEDMRLCEMLDWLLDQLEPLTDSLWALAEEGYVANWFCLLDVQDDEHATALTRETMRRLIALPGDLWLDVYREGKEDVTADGVDDRPGRPEWPDQLG